MVQGLRPWSAQAPRFPPAAADEALAAVGQKNLAAVREALAKLEIDIVYEETGGTRGRVVLFDNTCAKLEVKTIKPLVKRSNGKGFNRPLR